MKSKVYAKRAEFSKSCRTGKNMEQVTAPKAKLLLLFLKRGLKQKFLGNHGQEISRIT